MSDYPVVVDSYYDHDDHGRVHVVAFEDGEVSFEVVNASVTTSVGSISKGVTEPVEQFVEQTTPASVSVSASVESFEETEPHL